MTNNLKLKDIVQIIDAVDKEHFGAIGKIEE